MTSVVAHRRPLGSVAHAAFGSVQLLLRVAWRVLREIWWWFGRLARLLAGHPMAMVCWGLAVAWLVLRTWADLRNGGLDGLTVGLLGGLLLPVWLGGLWERFWPDSYREQIVIPAWRRRVEQGLRSGWFGLMESCGLSRRVSTQQGVMTHVPGLVQLCWRQDDLWARPVLMPGQTTDDLQAVAERLRVTVGAARIRVVTATHDTACWLVWSFADRLYRPFPAVVPDPAATLTAPDLVDGIAIGRTEDGGEWRLPLRLSTFVAGSSGSGKSSLIWGLLFGLAPGIRTGLVRVYGIDLKGGMELNMGRELFTRYAQQPAQAVALLEATAADLQHRATELAGRTRQHTPTIADPLVVLIVDELAALVAYLPDRDLTKRAEAALNIILSQGRAVGYVAAAFLQDPRKETVRNRHLFPQSLGLRLKDREEVAMVLGEGAIGNGAACHKISTSTPGIGYVLGESGRPVKVRAGHVTDAMIRHVATTFATPTCEVIEPSPVLIAGGNSTTRRPPRGSRRTTEDRCDDEKSSRDV